MSSSFLASVTEKCSDKAARQLMINNTWKPFQRSKGLRVGDPLRMELLKFIGQLYLPAKSSFSSNIIMIF